MISLLHCAALLVLMCMEYEYKYSMLCCRAIVLRYYRLIVEILNSFSPRYEPFVCIVFYLMNRVSVSLQLSLVHGLSCLLFPERCAPPDCFAFLPVVTSVTVRVHYWIEARIAPAKPGSRFPRGKVPGAMHETKVPPERRPSVPGAMHFKTCQPSDHRKSR